MLEALLPLRRGLDLVAVLLIGDPRFAPPPRFPSAPGQVGARGRLGPPLPGQLFVVGNPERIEMTDNKTEGKVDEGKGRLKEAAGDVTGDDSLKNEGKVDRAAGEAKEKAGEAADKVGDAISGVADRVKGKD